MTPAAAEAAARATEADRAALAEVLARPAFRDRLADGLALRRVLTGWWERLLALMETPEAERYAGLGRLVFLVAAAAAVALLWRAARRRGAPRALPAGARTGALPAGAAAVADDPAAGLAAAGAALAAGDLARAVRSAFAAAATALGSADRTGPELAAERGDPALADLARLHERTLFGRRPVTLGEAARALEVARRLASGPAAGEPRRRRRRDVPGGAG